MLKYLYIIICVAASLGIQAQPAPCCPEFNLTTVTNITPCTRSEDCNQQSATANVQPGQNYIYACKNTQQTYTVVPNLPGFTYTWSVTGGTPAVFTGNPATILWGGTAQGLLQVIITNASGTCRDTIRKKICLLDAPDASFVPVPGTTVCVNTPVQFNNTSTGGVTYYWEFGDGATSTSFSPQHTYTATGSYTVKLTVSNSSGELAGRCGCTDVFTMVINVVAGSGTTITSPNCNKMLCYNDTATYCVSPACPPFTWTVNGGTIIANNGSCVTVRWNVLPTTWPSSISVTTGCISACGSSATLNVPVLYPNIPIQGRNLVCPWSGSSYSLPALPGTFYSWDISGGGFITPYDSNHNVINVQWYGATGGPFIITCNYSNPYTGCSGQDTIHVYIRPPFTINGATSVCQNSTQLYAANGSANWNITPTSGYSPPGAPPGTFTGTSSLSLTWNTPGNYNFNAVPVTPSNYCNSSAGLSVVVNPAPVLNPISGPATVCPGQLYGYTASSNVTGGNYTWSFSSGTGTIAPYGPNNSLASVIFSGSGPWVLQATQTASGCSGSTTLNIAAVASPSAITLSAPAICSGGTITASVAGPVPPGGFTWSATPGAVLTSGQGTATATFTINSNATISVSNCIGTSTASVAATTISVTATATPAACSANLTASPAGATSYTWYLNGVVAGTGSPLNVTQNGTYVVHAVYPNGCRAVNQVTVTGITPVVVNITALGNLCVPGGSVTLTASIQANCPGPVNYVWSPSGPNSPINTVTAQGDYSVTVFCSNGCSAVSNVIRLRCGPPPPPCNLPNPVTSQTSQPSCSNPASFSVTGLPGTCTPLSTTWLWGDGTSSTGGLASSHFYTNVGNYIVQSVTQCANGNVYCDTALVTIPMVDSFTSVVSCGAGGWSIQLQDATLFLPSYSGYTRTWSTTCGTLSSTTSANPVLTVPIGCNPTVTLVISVPGCTQTKSVTFSFPTTTFSILGPNTVCRGQNYTFSSSLTAGILSYNWNFGDGTGGVTNPIQHAFNGVPPNPTITLTITDLYGCQFTATKPVTVYTPPALVINPSPLVQICPDCNTPTPLTATAGFTSYQWYRNGVAIPGATTNVYTLCNFNAAGNYYVTALSNPNNCTVTSNTVQVVYKPKPVADIISSSIRCVSGSGPYSVNLANAVNSANYTYSWTGSGPGSVSFSPNSTSWQVAGIVTAVGTYQFILTVTDITTGCFAKDTFCVIFTQSPVINVSAPANMCEGTSYTFTASATPVGPAYQYSWSNGVSGSTMTTSAAGNYYVTATDPVSGCTGTVFAGYIKPRPYVELFPVGCDTLCDTDTIVPPLPLGPSQTYNGVYTIRWYKGATLVHTGPNLPASLLSPVPGLHVLRIEVVFLGDNCVSVSGNYEVYIKKCGGCDCNNSYWGHILLTGGGMQLPLSCQSTVPLHCNQPYTVAADYFCAGTNCPGLVTYSLQPPAGPAITGSAPFTFTPTVSGMYQLTLYGWCGNKICDSCVIRFEVHCNTSCDCNGSYWKQITMTTGGAVKVLNCQTGYVVQGCDPITINADFQCPNPAACPGSVTYSLKWPSGSITTGTAPFTFTPSANGSYYLTLYGWCGGKLCDSCQIQLLVTDCPDGCDCKQSSWKQISMTTAGVSKLLDCKTGYVVPGCGPVTIDAIFDCGNLINCPGTVTYGLESPSGIITTGTAPFTFIPAENGSYNLTLYGWCGGKLCDSCQIQLLVTDCPDECVCDESGWDQITLTTTQVSYIVDCGKTYNAPCDKPFTVDGRYKCPDPDKCPDAVLYSMQPPAGPAITGTLPFTYTPTQDGVYRVTLYGYCGNKLCAVCEIRIVVSCDGTNKPVGKAAAALPEKTAPSNKMTLQPNPARNMVRIIVAEKHQQAAIMITDITGKQVLATSRRNSNNGIYDLTLHGLPAGTYLVKLITGTSTHTARLIKE